MCVRKTRSSRRYNSYCLLFDFKNWFLQFFLVTCNIFHRFYSKTSNYHFYSQKNHFLFLLWSIYFHCVCLLYIWHAPSYIFGGADRFTYHRFNDVTVNMSVFFIFFLFDRGNAIGTQITDYCTECYFFISLCTELTINSIESQRNKTQQNYGKNNKRANTISNMYGATDIQHV